MSRQGVIVQLWILGWLMACQCTVPAHADEPELGETCWAWLEAATPDSPFALVVGALVLLSVLALLWQIYDDSDGPPPPSSWMPS